MTDLRLGIAVLSEVCRFRVSRGGPSTNSGRLKKEIYRDRELVVAAIGYQTIGGIVSKETVCCVGGKVKH